jgi:hypothetical protein
MTTIGLAHILGRAIREVLDTEPFSGWLFTRTVEHEPKEQISYEFEGHGVDVICDRFDAIRTVFLQRGDGALLAGIPFSMSRREVLERFGPAAASGAAVRIPGFGDRGPWDRFTIPEGSLHVQYRTDREEIDMITLMRADAVP